MRTARFGLSPGDMVNVLQHSTGNEAENKPESSRKDYLESGRHTIIMSQIFSRLRDYLWHNTRVTMFHCPYCKGMTDVVGGAAFVTIDVGRAVCERCGKEFIIIDNIPMTDEQYRASKPQ